MEWGDAITDIQEIEESPENIEALRAQEEAAYENYVGPRGAGMPLRILARLLDTLWIVLCAIGAVVIAVIWLAIAGDPGSPQEWLRAAAKISFGGALLSIVASLSYQIASEFLGAASLGKIVFDLRVVDAKLKAITLKGSIIRNIVYIADSILMGLVAYYFMTKSPANQRLGDRLGRTLVMKRKEVPEELRPSIWVCFGGVLAGTAIAVLILIIRYIMRAAVRQ